MRRISVDERRARLGIRHHLAAQAASVEETSEGLVGLHASDPATVYLAAWARLDDMTRHDLQAALYDKRSLVRMLGMRRTMFVVTPTVAAVMDAACTRALVPPERRRLARMLEDQSITEDAEAWIDRVSGAVLESLASRGEATAIELKKDVPEFELKLVFGEGKKWGAEVGISTRILFLLATEGRIVRGRPKGTWLSSQYEWTLAERWLGHDLPTIDTASAQADLVQRWLRGFGPGTLTDIKWWTGWTVRDTRRALDAVDALEVDLDNGTGFLLPDDLDPIESRSPWVALLPSLDPTSMGWKERDWYFGAHAPQLFDRNGNAGPTVWCDGRVVGGWAQHPTGEVRFELFDDIGAEAQNAVTAQAHRLSRWLDGSVIIPRFRTPLEKRLST